MKIAIYGTGPIGSTFALHLSKGGHDVTCIARGPRLSQLREDGAIVTVDGDRAPITPAETLDPAIPFDLVIVTVLAHKVEAILPALKASAAGTILFMFNQFDPLSRLSEAIGPERVAFGFPAILATLEGGRLRSRIFTIGQKTIATERRWAELFTSVGIGTDVEPEMQSWLRTHAAMIVVVMAMAVSTQQRGAPLGLREAGTYVEALREGLDLVERLGDRVTPRAIRALRALPRPALSAILSMLSRTSIVEAVAAAGAAEPRAIADVMLASSRVEMPAVRAIRP